MAIRPEQGGDLGRWGTDLNAWFDTFTYPDSSVAGGPLRVDAIESALGSRSPVVLLWSVALGDYTPPDLKSSSRPKEFRGPTDPASVVGVVLNEFDTWIGIS